MQQQYSACLSDFSALASDDDPEDAHGYQQLDQQSLIRQDHDGC
jgi:hypothetical protein